jgi:enoyl-CoA hydratase/carnithine racemase
MLRIFFADFIRLLHPPTAIKLAEEELAHAQREMLKAHSAEEYAHHMANYHAERIERLTKFIEQQKA